MAAVTAAIFRFYAELNQFLTPAERQQPVRFSANGPVAVKHPIEAMGVPHTEVGLILANGRAVDFAYLLSPGDQISVYPPFRRLALNGLGRLRPPLAYPPQFVLDGHLGQLATYLRLLGFDTHYRNDFDDEELAEISHREGRVLLTRDRRLLMRKLVIHGYCLLTTDPEEQLLAVLHRFRLFDHLAPGSRCLRCNGRLFSVEKEAVLDRLEPKTRQYYDQFYRCDRCDQIYWKGSHYDGLEALIERVRRAA